MPVVLDVEASGFGRASYPIEVGFVLADGSGHCTLVCPQAAWTHWDESAQAAHGIRRDDAVMHGRPVAEVAHWLNERLGGQTVYCDGWAHDYPWLHALFEAAEVRPRFRLAHVLDLLDERQTARFDATRAQVEAELGLPRHRASHDARIVQATVTRLRARAE